MPDTDKVDRPDDLGPSRRRVLGRLQDSAHPLTIATMASSLGLHPNSVRFHLDALLELGLVRKVVEQRRRRGRPRVLFTASPTVPPLTDAPFRDLATALLHYVRAEETAERPLAEQVGYRWGAELGATAPPGADIHDLVGVVNRLGFTSRLAEDADGRRLEIGRCPFREYTRGDDKTICRIHLGMMRGYLHAIGSSEWVSALEPWVQPELCVARLLAADEAAPPPAST